MVEKLIIDFNIGYFVHRQGEKRSPSRTKGSIFDAVYVQKNQVKTIGHFFPLLSNHLSLF